MVIWAMMRVKVSVIITTRLEYEVKTVVGERGIERLGIRAILSK